MRILRATLAVVVLLALAAVLGWLGKAWWDSRLPGTYDAMAYAVPDYGGGPVTRHDHSSGFNIARLTGARVGKPDHRFTLHARHARVRLSAGRTIDALTFDGSVPGPELRVHQGDLVEVALVNDDVEDGVTIHWHGLDVPNAEDGVAGVTQDAVRPGGRYVYRFRAEQPGTFWYHSHQAASDEVARGLFGAIVVEPAGRSRAAVDMTLVAHDADGTLALNGVDAAAYRTVRPGTHLRVRLVNTESTPQRFGISGTPFRVLAIDGTDLRNGRELIQGQSLELAAGGRYDVGFTMPRAPVAVGLTDAPARYVFTPDGRTTAPPVTGGTRFDPLHYGLPGPTPFGADSHFDRSFQLKLTQKLGFLDGKPGRHWALNGRLYPRVPMFMVRPGDLVRVEIANDTGNPHPMHLHGHHVLVLSRDGRPSTGSPWWSDTLNVEAHTSYVVAFRADNPGIWMDHCHNLGHAAQGLTMHVAYEGMATPYRIGGATHNEPE
jgi:FtsP/CotA-like multicopper oxidase with cupredoxin domain